MCREVGAGFGGLCRRMHIESRPGIADDDGESPGVDLNPAADGLGRIVSAAMQNGVGQGFLQGNEDIGLFQFAAAMWLNELHDRVARRGHGFRISGKGELFGDPLLFCGLRSFLQETSSSYHAVKERRAKDDRISSPAPRSLTSASATSNTDRKFAKAISLRTQREAFTILSARPRHTDRQ